MTAALFDLSGQRALVTGASRGLGQGMALALARAGARLVLTARDRDSLQATEALFAAGGLPAPECHALDQSHHAAIAPAMAAIGPCDILVANAGTEEVRPSDAVDEDLWDRIVDTNLKGAFFVTQAAARPMLDRGAGSIILICSLTSHVGVPTAAPYGTSKTGLLGLMRALSAEWAPRGVRVNGIAPGYFRTALTEPFYADPAWTAAMQARIPQGRFGQTQDLDGAVIYLASRASAYVTGHCLTVDGGYLASI